MPGFVKIILKKNSVINKNSNQSNNSLKNFNKFRDLSENSSQSNNLLKNSDKFCDLLENSNKS